MENLSQVDDTVAEYLLFRGFTDVHLFKTYAQFNNDRKKDKTEQFNVDKIVDHLYTAIKQYNYEDLLSLWNFLYTRFFAFLDIEYSETVATFYRDIRKLFIINCLQNGKKDIIIEYLNIYGEEMLKERTVNQDDWKPWCSIPFIQHPEKDEYFAIYFTNEWKNNLRSSLTNFLRTIFHNLPMPRLLAFKISNAQTNILNTQLKAKQAELEEAQASLTSIQENYIKASSAISQLNDIIQSRIIAIHKLNIPLTTPEIALCNELNNVLNTLPYVKTLSDDIEDMNKTTTIDHIDNTSYRVIEESTDSTHAESLTLSEPLTVASFSEPVTNCKWSKNGDYIAVTGKDASLYIYSYAEGRVNSYSLTYCSSDITCLQWTSDNNLVYGCSDGIIYIYNPLKKKHLNEIKVDLPIITDLDVTSQYIACSSISSSSESRTALSIYNLATGALVTKLVNSVGYRINCVCMTEHELVITGSSDGYVRIYSMESINPKQEIKTFQGQCTGLSVKNNSFYVSGTDGYLYEYDLEQPKTPLNVYTTTKPAVVTGLLHSYISLTNRLISSSEEASFLPTYFITTGTAIPGVTIFKQGCKAPCTTNQPLTSFTTCCDMHPSEPVYLVIDEDQQVLLFTIQN